MHTVWPLPPFLGQTPPALSSADIFQPAVFEPIVVVDYDPSWPEIFQLLRQRIVDELGCIAAAVAHVGSTSVIGLQAKPIIDIDVLLSENQSLTEAIERLRRLGYRHEGDLGISGREAFKAMETDPPHHLYVCVSGSAEFERHLAFRDYLRANPADAKVYGELKKSLAQTFREDRKAYLAGKSDMVSELTNRALAKRRASAT
jgi:GrpB-like predicted nucleotidyltransferase (UPF0157 family)